jgi:hypothetical protein
MAEKGAKLYGRYVMWLTGGEKGGSVFRTWKETPGITGGFTPGDYGKSFVNGAVEKETQLAPFTGLGMALGPVQTFRAGQQVRERAHISVDDRQIGSIMGREHGGRLVEALAALGGIAGELAGAPKPTPTTVSGEFSIIDWTNYPANIPRPTGPFRILEGEEYAAAREAADTANAAIRAEYGLDGSGLHIHEIQPVKFGGSPTDPANKMLLPWQDHIGQEGVHTVFWTPLLKSLRGQ